MPADLTDDLPRYWAAASLIGRTDTNTRPLVLVRNSTLPLIRAKSVWSLPTPTLRPGCHLVPRWRAMMLPASTSSPPKIFSPRRCPAESRPLREDPPAFLCAITASATHLFCTYTDFVTKASPPMSLVVVPLLLLAL